MSTVEGPLINLILILACEVWGLGFGDLRLSS